MKFKVGDKICWVSVFNNEIGCGTIEDMNHLGDINTDNNSLLRHEFLSELKVEIMMPPDEIFKEILNK